MTPVPRKLTSEEVALNIDISMNPDTTTVNGSWILENQERAVLAMEMAMSIQGNGYNVFAIGESGVGKFDLIQQVLDRNRENNNNLRDIAYIQDFQGHGSPIPLFFPAGQAMAFQKDIQKLLKRFENIIFDTLATESYKSQRDSFALQAEQVESKAFTEFQVCIQADGFCFVQNKQSETELSPDIAPIINGRMISFEALHNCVLSGEVTVGEWMDIRRRYFVHSDTMKQLLREFKIAQDTQLLTLQGLQVDMIRPKIEAECSAVAKKWPGEKMETYFKSLVSSVLSNINWFISENENDKSDLELYYGINIVVDRSGSHTLPVIMEFNPTKNRLFGSVEIRTDNSGEIQANQMMIKPGSLLNADGGYLLLLAEDLLVREGIWQDLKRVLQTGLVTPEVPSTPLGPPPITMEPHPVHAHVTVILMGSERCWETLCAMDDEFPELFKIIAPFTTTKERSIKTEQEYAALIHNMAVKSALLPITPDGIQAVILHSIALTEQRDKLSMRLGLIEDLLQEANNMAQKKQVSTIDETIVKMTVDRREYMANLPEQSFLEDIQNGTILLNVDGSCIGEVNGLAVLERTASSFGIPLHITATVSPGKDGLINIERESGLSGEIHDKGIFLLEGYLRYRYARHQQLSLTASIAVEQSYTEIDGDSASVAELVALLSAIASLPIRQDVAITGAVNQHGYMQSVGGIKQKVWSFFQICKMKGLTGRQGLIIPVGNINNVILPEPVIKAMQVNQFHIWAARDIDEVMVLLTGQKAGAERRNGHFESHSVNEKIRKGLIALAS